jgi:hypothetical protein
MITITNAEFLHVLFKDAPRGAVPWVTGFSEDPYKANGEHWAGAPVTNGTLPWCIKEDRNTFMAISTFYKRNEPRGEKTITRYRRRKKNFAACHLLMVDDVGTKIQPHEIPLEPSYKLETSPGNYQYSYLLAEPCTDRERVEKVLDMMIAKGLAVDGKDPGMKGVTRYGRLPVGQNTKTKYIEKLGAPFVHQLEEWHPERQFRLEDIIEAFELDISSAGPEEDKQEEGDLILKALKERGLTKNPIGGKPGVWDITCPWVSGHTDEIDNGTAYFQPFFDGRDKPGFKCHHGSCEGRNVKDLLRFLDYPNVVYGDGEAKANPSAEKRCSFKWVVKELRARGGLAYDTFTNAPFIDGERFLDRDHVGKLRLWFQEKTGAACGKETMRDALNAVFAENKFSALRAWFDALEPWDGTPRLNLWLFHVYGVTGHAKYISLIGPAWLMSGVARAYQPGVKVRAVLLLIGPEEIGKSESLIDTCPCPEWVTDSLPDLHHPHAPAHLFGRFFVEIPELAAMRKSYREAIKNFLGKECDDYLAKYEVHQTKHPRQCIFAGTSNDIDVLNSLDDNTRFWPVAVNKYDREWLLANKRQLWAEAKHRYLAGEKWYFTEQEHKKLLALERLSFVESDPWDDEVYEWLDIRSGYTKGTDKKAKATTAEALDHLGVKEPWQRTKQMEMRVAGIFRKFGWKKRESHGRTWWEQ